MAFQRRGNVFTLENNSSDFRHMKIGSTFDCVSCKRCDVLPQVEYSGIEKEPITTYNWNILEVKNKRSLHEAFGFKNTMSLKVSAGQINADSMMSFEKSLSDASDKTWLMFDCKYERMKETLPSRPSRDENGHYGTHYVRSLVRGGKVLILCQLSSDKTIQSCKSKLDQATTFNIEQLNLKLAEQKLQVDGSATAETQDDFVNIHFYSTVRTTKQPTTSSEVYSFIKTFREELDKETNFEPVQFELCPFEIANSEEYSSSIEEFYMSYEDALETDRTFAAFIKSNTFSRFDESGRKLMHTYRQKVKGILSGFNETVCKANMEGLGTDAGKRLQDYNDFISENASQALSMKTLLDQLMFRLSGGVDRLGRLLPTLPTVSSFHDLTVLVVGHTGSGKTALVEFLSTGKTSGGTRTTESGTEKFNEVKTTFDGKKITYLDTPGFYDTNCDNKNLSFQEIKKAFKATQNGCDVVLFVVSVQHSKQKAEKVFQDLKWYHGREIVNHMIVAFTFTEVGNKKLDLDSLKNDDKWKQTVVECGNRAIGIDSAEMTTQQEHNEVWKCLSVMMNRLYLDNNKKSYMPPQSWCTIL